MMKTNGKLLKTSINNTKFALDRCNNRKVLLRTGHSRGTGGTGMVEACAFLVFFSLLFASGVLFFINSAEVGYYKYKLACVTDRTAEYMAALVYFAGAENPNFAGTNRNSKATILVDKLLKDCGLPKSSSVETSIKGRLLTVKITVPDLPLFESSSMLPSKITLSDIAVVPIPISQPPAVMSLTYGGQKVLIPVYGSSTSVGTARFYNWGGSYFQSSFALPTGSAYTATP